MTCSHFYFRGKLWLLVSFPGRQGLAVALAQGGMSDEDAQPGVGVKQPDWGYVLWIDSFYIYFTPYILTIICL